MRSGGARAVRAAQTPIPPCSTPPSTPSSRPSCRRRRSLRRTEDTRPYECDGLTLYRAVPAAVAIPENEAQVVAILKRCHEARVPVVARGAGTSLSGGRDARSQRRAAVDGQVQADPLGRPARAHRGRAAGRAQCVDHRGGGAARALLRARPVVADHLHDRRQRRRERGRRPLSQVRAHRAQRPTRARRAHHRRGRRVRQRRARLAGLRPARARRPAPKGSSPSSPRSR